MIIPTLPLSPLLSWLLMALVVLAAVIGAWAISIFLALWGTVKQDDAEYEDLINAKLNYCGDFDRPITKKEKVNEKN